MIFWRRPLVARSRPVPVLMIGLKSPSHRNPRDMRCIIFTARGFGGRYALNMSPRQLKEVIQVAHTIVGSVAPLGALVGTEASR
jgi:hypothetical protein